MKKIILVAVSLIMVLCCLCSCGEAKTADITSSWKLESMTLNGKTDSDTLLSLDPKAPKFSCKDGKNVIFSLNGKTHNGTLTESGGVYFIDYDDTYKTMEARISGDKLIIKLKDSDKMELVFKLS
ncbi:MAG: hypothetical protein ACI4I1_09635 [Oscillospiraceae bacterium]